MIYAAADEVSVAVREHDHVACLKRDGFVARHLRPASAFDDQVADSHVLRFGREHRCECRATRCRDAPWFTELRSKK
jgi:hypothetical protein